MPNDPHIYDDIFGTGNATEAVLNVPEQRIREATKHPFRTATDPLYFGDIGGIDEGLSLPEKLRFKRQIQQRNAPKYDATKLSQVIGDVLGTYAPTLPQTKDFTKQLFTNAVQPIVQGGLRLANSLKKDPNAKETLASYLNTKWEQVLAGAEIGINAIPTMTLLNSVAPLVRQGSGDTAEAMGLDRKVGEEFGDVISMLPFGKIVIGGMLASRTAKEFADFIIKDMNLSDDIKAKVLETASHLGFFGGAIGLSKLAKRYQTNRTESRITQVGDTQEPLVNTPLLMLPAPSGKESIVNPNPTPDLMEREKRIADWEVNPANIKEEPPDLHVDYQRMLDLLDIDLKRVEQEVMNPNLNPQERVKLMKDIENIDKRRANTKEQILLSQKPVELEKPPSEITGGKEPEVEVTDTHKEVGRDILTETKAKLDKAITEGTFEAIEPISSDSMHKYGIPVEEADKLNTIINARNEIFKQREAISEEQQGKLDKLKEQNAEIQAEADRQAEAERQKTIQQREKELKKKYVTDEEYKQAKKELNNKIRRLNMTFGLDTLPELVKIGKYHYDKIPEYAQWTKQMLKEFGDKVKPYLEKIWEEVKAYATGDKAFIEPGSIGLFGGNLGKSFQKVKDKGETFLGKYDKKQRYEIDDSKARLTKKINDLYDERVALLDKVKPLIEYDKSQAIEKLRGLGYDTSDIPPDKIPFSWSEFYEKHRTDSNVKKLSEVIEKLKGLKLPDILHHPEFYREYPEAKNISVEFAKDIGLHEGGFDPETSTIGINPRIKEQNTPNILLHEAQHWLQEKENFARGANYQQYVKQYENNQAMLDYLHEKVNMMYDARNIKTNRATQKELDDYYEDPEKSAELDYILKEYTLEDIKLEMEKLGKQIGAVDVRTPLGMYVHTAGEIEARDVQARQHLNKKQRREKEPYSSEFIPEGMAKVYYDNSNVRYDLKRDKEEEKIKSVNKYGDEHTFKNLRDEVNRELDSAFRNNPEFIHGIKGGKANMEDIRNATYEIADKVIQSGQNIPNWIRDVREGHITPPIALASRVLANYEMARMSYLNSITTPDLKGYSEVLANVQRAVTALAEANAISAESGLILRVYEEPIDFNKLKPSDMNKMVEGNPAIANASKLVEDLEDKSKEALLFYEGEVNKLRDIIKGETKALKAMQKNPAPTNEQIADRRTLEKNIEQNKRDLKKFSYGHLQLTQNMKMVRDAIAKMKFKDKKTLYNAIALVRYNFLLSGLTTQAVNLFGNFGNIALEQAELVSTGEGKAVARSFKPQHLKDAGSSMINYFLGRENLTGAKIVSQESGGFETLGESERAKQLLKSMDYSVGLPLKTMGAVDAGFYRYAYGLMKERQMMHFQKQNAKSGEQYFGNIKNVEKLFNLIEQNAPENMNAYEKDISERLASAVRYAELMTFRSPLKGNFATGLKKISDTVFGLVTLPFVSTLVNLMKMSGKHSPAPLFKLLSSKERAHYQNELTKLEKKDFSRRIIIGTGLTLAIAKLMSDGDLIVTGSLMTGLDPQANRNFIKTLKGQGIQPNQIGFRQPDGKFHTITYTNIPVFNNILFGLGAISDMIRYGGSPDEKRDALTTAVKAGLNFVMSYSQQTLLSSFNYLFQAGANLNANYVFDSAISWFVPAVVMQQLQSDKLWQEPNRKSDDEATFGSDLTKRVARKFGIESEYYIPQRGVFGEQMDRFKTRLPFTVNEIGNDKVLNLLIANRVQVNDRDLSDLAQVITDSGESDVNLKDMSPADVDKFNESVGRAFKKAMTSAYESIDRLPSQKSRQKAIYSILNSIAKQVKNKMMLTKDTGVTPEELQLYETNKISPMWSRTAVDSTYVP